MADQTFVYQTLILQRQPEAVPARIVEAWAQHTIAVIDTKMIPGWTALLESEDHFLATMANPAAEGYAHFLNPELVTRKGVSTVEAMRHHGLRLKASYTKIQEAIAFMLGDGRAEFEQRLLDTQPGYQTGEALPLSLTGDYFEHVLGAAVRQWFFIGQTAKFDQYRWASDTLIADPPPSTDFLRGGDGGNFAKRFVRLLIQGGCLLLLGQALDKVHQDLDALLGPALALKYDLPPRSTTRLALHGGLPFIRTELVGLEVPRLPPHTPPICPSFTFDFAITVPTGFDSTIYNEVVLADIPHLATFADGAEFQSMIYGGTHFPDLAQVSFQDPETHLLLDTLGTSTTTLVFGTFQDLYITTQAGLNYMHGEGAFPVEHEMTVWDHDHHDRVFQGRVFYYQDTLLRIHVLSGSHGSGSGSNWDIYQRSLPQELRAVGTIHRGEVLYGEYFYDITDNFGATGRGYFTVRVTGV